jgi:hypothetical protein
MHHKELREGGHSEIEGGQKKGCAAIVRCD